MWQLINSSLRRSAYETPTSPVSQQVSFPKIILSVFPVIFSFMPTGFSQPPHYALCPIWIKWVVHFGMLLPYFIGSVFRRDVLLLSKSQDSQYCLVNLEIKNIINYSGMEIFSFLAISGFFIYNRIVVSKMLQIQLDLFRSSVFASGYKGF